MLNKLQLEVLKNQVSDLTWQGKYWGAHGAIAKSRFLYKHKKAIDDQHPLNGLSSTYYSAAGNAFSRASLLKPWWFIIARFCFWRAIKLSDQMVQKLGINFMSPDELDIRAAILRKAKRFEEALECINEALSCPGISDGTQVLLEIGQGEVFNIIGKLDKAVLAYLRAEALYLQTDPKVQVRFLRSYARHLILKKDEVLAEYRFKQALELAEDNDLPDQVTKIKFELAQYA